jgi:branched-chain amino acid transport system permease protein
MAQVVVQGIITGLLFGLSGLGLVFIFRATGVVNFAHGPMVTFSLFVMTSLLASGVPFGVALMLILAVAIGLGLVTDSGMRLVRQGDELSYVMATLAIGLVIRGIVSLVWGSQTRAITLPFPDGGHRLGPVYLEWASVWTFVIGLVFVTAAFAFMRFTRAGLGMRAVFEDEQTARLLGVPVKRLRRTAWALGGFFAAAAGVLVVPQTYLNESSLITFALVSFAAITIGGLSNMFGTVIGGVLMGVVVNLVALWFSSSLASTATLVLILVVLFLRPEGLLSSRRFVKV